MLLRMYGSLIFLQIMQDVGRIAIKLKKYAPQDENRTITIQIRRNLT